MDTPVSCLCLLSLSALELCLAVVLFSVLCVSVTTVSPPSSSVMPPTCDTTNRIISGPLAHPCDDTRPDCAYFSLHDCMYTPWVQDACPKHCGVCKPDSTSTSRPCADLINNCYYHGFQACSQFRVWSMYFCPKYCGHCVNVSVEAGFFGKCLYKGKTYEQSDTWEDGCSYQCECTDAAAGRYECYNLCYLYYNLHPQCTLVRLKGECCLQPVCNFEASYLTTVGYGAGYLFGSKVCDSNGTKYHQGQTWTVDCDLQCVCQDAETGLYTCQSLCAHYASLPSGCKLIKEAGECCPKPVCTYFTIRGTFNGTSHPSSKEVSCGTNDGCLYNGKKYKQGEQWNDGCERRCVCESATYGYYRCDNKCPIYKNQPSDCVLVPVEGQCCKALVCNCGTVISAQTVPGVIGDLPCNTSTNGGSATPGQTNHVYVVGVTSPSLLTMAGRIHPHPHPYHPVLVPSVIPYNGTLAYGFPLAAGGTHGYPAAPNYVSSPYRTMYGREANNRAKRAAPPTLPWYQSPLPQNLPLPAGVGPNAAAFNIRPFPCIPINPNQPVLPGVVTVLQMPPKLDGCVYKGAVYQTGQRWTDSCTYSCICEDGSTGRYQCLPQCPDFPNLDSRCKLHDTPDSCCKTLKCTGNATVISTIGPVVTGFFPAIFPSLTGCNLTSCTTGEKRDSNNATSGKRGCMHRNQTYHVGGRWEESSRTSCKCLDDYTGSYTCTDRCLHFPTMPSLCYEVRNASHPLCQAYACNDTDIVTERREAGESKADRDYCLYQGRYYTQEEEWQDGCALVCRCEYARLNFYQCSARCPTYSDVPLGCRLVTDPKDDCCKIPLCDDVAVQLESGLEIPQGFNGTYGNNIRAPDADLNGTKYAAACFFNGTSYNQDDEWNEGCVKKCKCTNAQNGTYECTSRCQRFSAMPAGCMLVPDPEDKCCQKPECIPQSCTFCHDLNHNCNCFHESVCWSFPVWARRHCAYRCDLCVCEDKIKNCQSYGRQICEAHNETWSHFYCASYCGFCGFNSTEEEIPVEIVTRGQEGGDQCRDRLTGCERCTDRICREPFFRWARDNCARTCNLCPSPDQSTDTDTWTAVPGVVVLDHLRPKPEAQSQEKKSNVASTEMPGAVISNFWNEGHYFMKRRERAIVKSPGRPEH